MATRTLKLNVRTGDKDGVNYWDRCGVVFVNIDDNGNITSLTVKHNMFPNVEMVAFPTLSKTASESLNNNAESPATDDEEGEWL